MKQIIKNKLNEITNLCKANQVARLYTFGSVNSEDFNDTSDVDLIVELNQADPAEKGEILMNLWDDFERLFNRKVDLLSSKTVRNPYLQKGIDDTIQLIYES
jgi:predicted nucleotidyltransferase